MQNDQPSIVRKMTPKPKISWTEQAFLEAFNKKYADSYELMACNQDYHTFDFWLMSKNSPNLMPRIVELKLHRDKHSHDRGLVGCDVIKLQKLRALSVGTKAYVFHLFLNETLVQNVDQEFHELRKTVWDGNEVLLALMSISSVERTIPIGLSDLKSQLSSG